MASSELASVMVSEDAPIRVDTGATALPLCGTVGAGAGAEAQATASPDRTEVAAPRSHALREIVDVTYQEHRSGASKPARIGPAASQVVTRAAIHCGVAIFRDLVYALVPRVPYGRAACCGRLARAVGFSGRPRELA